MAESQKPIIDGWYEDLEGRAFKVVAIDEDAGTVEVQYFEGDIEEFDLDTWEQLELEPVATPEDWTGPFDDLIADDLGDTDRPMRPENWNGPADEMDLKD